MQISYKKLFKLLIDLDMKKSELAEKAGVNRGTLSNMAKGHTVTDRTMTKICSALHCSPDDIMEFVPA